MRLAQKEDEIIAAEGRRTWRLRMRAFAATVVIVTAIAYAGVLDVDRYRDFLPAMGTIIAEAVPPDWSRWPVWLRAVLETVTMAVAGTAIGAVLAFALTLVALPMCGAPKPVRFACRALFAVFRSLPELVLGTVLVAAVGFGALPGTWALALHSFGMLGRFYLTILKTADPAPVSAILSQGASPLLAVRFALLPQVWYQLADVTIYRFEHNVRASTIIGMVGAGGLGLELISAMRLFEYREMSALLLITLGLVLAVDAVGQMLRGRF
ncbi:MAG TPA: phosphonate ABC transporter, permease protein PhnE [Rhizobiaceae bacterium]|nr:phosphonate ABC transporter, permease protein PhnE [Rhizobiaceae bacterium]